MTVLIALGACIATTLGASLLYLSAPHQKLRPTPLPRQPWVAIGGIALLFALILFWQIAGTATAFFILFTLLMSLWSIPPLGIAYARARRDKQP